MTIKESQSVITWDFDVMKGDVQYTVFRHKRPREAVSSTSLSSFGSDVSLNQSGVIAGVDAVVVEKPRHCFDGESIQVYNTNNKLDILCYNPSNIIHLCMIGLNTSCDILCPS